MIWPPIDRPSHSTERESTVFSPHHTSPEQHTGDIQARPTTQPFGKPPVGLLRLLIALLVGGIAIASFVNQCGAPSSNLPAPAPVSTAVAPTAAECVTLVDLYSRWIDTGAPTIQAEMSALNVDTVEVAIKTGQAFAYDLAYLRAGAILVLRGLAEEYVEAMRTLKVAIGKDAATHEQAVGTAFEVVAALHRTYKGLIAGYCG